MKLVVGTFLTLDGVMQAPGGPEEDRSGGFEHGGWSVSYFDDVMGRVMTDWIERADGLLLGRKTYEIFAAHWPHVTDGDPTTAKLNGVRKYVASRKLDRADWNNSSMIQGDVVDEVRKLKGEPGDELQVHGSGDLLKTLLRADLIDTFRLWIFPVVLGTGKRLFAEGTLPSRFELAETRTSGTGVVLEVLHASGRPTYGSFALEQPPADEIERRQRIETGK